MSTSVYPIEIGAIRGRVLLDGVQLVSADDLARIFPDDNQRIRAASPDEAISLSGNILFLETAGKHILVDTGIGNLRPDLPGQMQTRLRESGVEPESIDTVILSHFHMDHIGGLLGADGQAAFPNARLVASRMEYDHWMREDLLATLDEVRAGRLRQTFAAYPRLVLLEGQAEVEPGVSLLPAPGHTPGHCAIWIESEGAHLLHVVDSWHCAAQVQFPDARPVFDVQPELAISTRRDLLARAEAESLRLLAYHLAFPGLGHIQRQSEHMVWLPV